MIDQEPLSQGLSPSSIDFQEYEGSHRQNDTGWTNFEQSILQSQQGFLLRLAERYSTITLHERRLCLLLRMNITTREIAYITKQSPHSIRIARTRLRKKLNLTHSETDLVRFLMNI